MFRKRSKTGAPDPDFPFLSEADAATIRALARDAFAEAGIEVTVFSDRLERHDGAAFGLSNLMANCFQTDPKGRQWRTIVGKHVAALTTPENRLDIAASMSNEELTERCFLRVIGLHTIDDEMLSWFRYARSVSTDILETLGLDLPDSVLTFRDEDVDRVGHDVLVRSGLDNLLAEPIDDIDSVPLEGGGVLRVLSGSSVYTASRILAMTDLLKRVYDDSEHPYGVLVAVPHRHVVVLHSVRDANTIEAINVMAHLAAGEFQSNVGPVSPFLHWWSGTMLHQISRVDDTGEIGVDATGEFGDVLSRLAGD